MSTNPATVSLQDLTAIDAAKHTTEEWQTLITAMHGEDTVLVSGSVGLHFLGVLPPRWMSGRAFAFCEGDDRYTVFVGVGSNWLMCTLPYGERTPNVLDSRAREMGAAYGRHCLAESRPPRRPVPHHLCVPNSGASYGPPLSRRQ